MGGRSSGLEMAIARALTALGNDRRAQILDGLRDRRAHFRDQVGVDLVKDGLFGLLIAGKPKVRQNTLSDHKPSLMQAELVTAKRIKKWSFYRRNDAKIAALRASISHDV